MRSPATIATFLFLAAHAFAGEHVAGWRGDGTGKFPDAHPPLTWSRTSVALSELRFSVAKPAEPAAGTAMSDGVVREWLVAGPLPLVENGKAEPVALQEEAALDPSAGDKAGDTAWKRVQLDSAYLDFKRLLGQPEDTDTAALAFTRVYSPAGGKFQLNLTGIAKATLWVNGVKSTAQPSQRTMVPLASGWNRLLLRVVPGDKDWYAVPVFHGRGKYTESGIAWRAALPGMVAGFYNGGMGVGSPVIVGDHLYLQSEPHDLICLRKSDGKVQWIRRASYFEAATDAERNSPAYAEAAGLAAKIDAINAACVAGAASQTQFEEKGKLETELRKQMQPIDEAKYANQQIPDVGFSGFTPCTDGRFIYCWFGDGVSACFDLAGQRRWIRVDQHLAVEHGFSSSPALADGKLIAFMRDLIAIDCATGQTSWEVPIVAATGLNPPGFFHGTPVTAEIDGTTVVLLGNGMIVRARDGKVVWQEKPLDNQAVSSPVVDGRHVLNSSHGNRDFTLRTLPEKFSEPLEVRPAALAVDTSAFPKHYLPWHITSPLVHEGLAYFLNNAGVLSVLELATRKVVYQSLLDLDVFQGHNEGASRGIGVSPALVGPNLLLLGNNGAALVIAPGREFHQLAKNKIESFTMPGHWAERQERFIANPIAEGDRLYLRSEAALYAIGTH